MTGERAHAQRHAAGLPGSDSRTHIFAGTIAYGNQNIPHGSVDEAKNSKLKPAAFVSCSLYPPGE